MKLLPPDTVTISTLDVFPGEIQLDLLREDLVGGAIQGNKFRKLFYNLKEAEASGCHTLISFGGAYSNHIAALAAAAAQFGFKSIGLIRGEELAQKWKQNPTLVKAASLGMELQFLSRSDYKKRHDPKFLEDLSNSNPGAYIIPEGGTNSLAIKGCMEILSSEMKGYDYVAVPVGTGGTMAGLIEAAGEHQNVIGFSSLKGDFLKDEIAKWTSKDNWTLNTDFSFGGYAKINQQLIAFINQFKQSTGISLDPVYTGKMMYGLYKLLKAAEFPEKSRILAVHTGGLQGIEGMNARIAQKGLPPLLI